MPVNETSSLIFTTVYTYICDWCDKEISKSTYIPPLRCCSCGRYGCADHAKLGHTEFEEDSSYWYCEDCWSFGKSYREKIKKMREVIEEYEEEIEQLEEAWEKEAARKFGIESKKGN